MLDRLVRRPTWQAAAVTVPLLALAVTLLWRPWAPVLDLAMTEYRVRDVGGRFTPRIGLPGRIGDFPDQGSHPGPWSFYFIAPFYRLGGATAWGMQFGSIVINSAAVAGTVLIGRRLAGTSGAIVLGVVTAVAIRGYGLTVLSHPWNPYFPLLLWLLLLVAAWGVLVGHHRLAIVVAVCATTASQTHVPYLVSTVSVAVLVLISLIVQIRGADREHRRPIVNSLAWALGVTIFMWIPPIVDQIRRDPGNFTMLYRHFTGEPDGELVSIWEAARVFLRHLDVFGAGWQWLGNVDAFVARSGAPYNDQFDASVVGGLVVLLAWLMSAYLAWQRRDRVITSLNVVLAVALLAGFVSMTRIFGKIWFYLTLWAWATMLLVVASTIWTAIRTFRDRPEGSVLGVWPQRAGVGVATLATVLSIGAIVVYDVPEPNLSDGLRELVPDTAAALDQGVGDAVGADGTYLVFWQDSVFIGSQGYGLVNELERRGYDVGVHLTWRVPVTHHRVLAAGTFDAEVHLVSGKFVDEWRLRPDHVEVATVDVRTDAERERFAMLRVGVGDRLSEIGRADFVEVVDANLFGASLDPDLPQDIIDDLGEMLLLGEPVSVFIAPPGSSF